MSLNTFFTAALLLTLSSLTTAQAQKPTGGITGKTAPKWEATDWKNLPDGKKSLELSDLKGKTVYLYCFQSWCPGCHSHGFPTLKKVQEKYADDKDVVFVAIQTVFEGFSTNTVAKGEATLKKFKLDIPLGYSGSKANPSKLMRNYRTRGTPWTIIIGKDGKVLADGFRIDTNQAIKLIEKDQKTTAKTKDAKKN